MEATSGDALNSARYTSGGMGRSVEEAFMMDNPLLRENCFITLNFPGRRRRAASA